VKELHKVYFCTVLGGESVGNTGGNGNGKEPGGEKRNDIIYVSQHCNNHDGHLPPAPKLQGSSD